MERKVNCPAGFSGWIWFGSIEKSWEPSLENQIVKFFTKFLRDKKRLANIVTDVSRAANFWRPFGFG